VASLARRTGYSVKHFGRLVCKHCGVSPREMIVRIRMHRAMEMLRATDVTLDAIAARLGHDTGFSSSRAFKQYAGKSPKAFRAECVQRD
jgi:transcriptional regulator GlxA family with amidase domain